MSGAFDSDNTTGSAWLGASVQRPSKRGRPSAWKMRNDRADSFLAGKHNFSSKSGTNRTKVRSTNTAIKKSNPKKHPTQNQKTANQKAAKQKPARLISQPSERHVLTEMIDSLKKDLAEAAQTNQTVITYQVGDHLDSNNLELSSTSHPQLIKHQTLIQQPNYAQLGEQVKAGQSEHGYASWGDLLQDLDKIDQTQLKDAAKDLSKKTFNSSPLFFIAFLLFLFIIMF